MNGPDVSDLEEGEILEYDLVPSSYSRDNLGIRNFSSSAIKEYKSGRFGYMESKRLYLMEENDVGSLLPTVYFSEWDQKTPYHGYLNMKLRGKLNVTDKGRENKSSISMPDLESISSDGEYKSDEGDKSSANENECHNYSNGEMKKRKKKHSSHFYGAVEDIMSEIGETICRKSRCNYKKRKSKELTENLEKCSNYNYDQWRREIFSSHLKTRRHKRKGNFCESNTDLGKHRTEKRKKRKKASYEEEETPSEKLKLRDFDEMRRSLLEKLKKQKAEEESKESLEEAPLELENSEIQEIDMLIDCTNYVDNPPDPPQERRRPEEMEGEDESDLIKLRLIALASNKKRRAVEETSDTGKPENFLMEEKSSGSREEGDLDRSELLLRAEALKTALLKKHQKRLNKLKMTKPVETGSSSITEEGNSLLPAAEGTLEKESAKLDADVCKENVEGESKRETGHSADMERSKGTCTALPSNENSKKAHLRAKSKRKKRKSLSFANSSKENNEKSESLEEDDSTLRTQLLSDLMRKKSLKDQEKKSVLLDFIQTGANKPSPSAVPADPPKDGCKPLPGVKKNLLKKVNVPKTIKPAVVPKFPKPDIQRIIVHLGSEDSSDEDAVLEQPAASPQEGKESGRNAATELSSTSEQAAKMMKAKYERSVEQLLSQARRKIEGEKRTAAAAAANPLATPEAVYKHLPPSQRLEYMRLKQKIAERESLKKQRTEIVNNSSLAVPDQQSAVAKESVPRKPQPGQVVQNSSSESSSPQKNMCDAHKPGVIKNATSDSKASGGCSSPGKTKEMSRPATNKMKNNLGATARPPNSLKTAALAERNLLLLPSSQALLSKLKLLLKKIKIEKMIEENYEKEISKLKNQLGLFEKKKCEQRFKIKKIWEESMKCYKAIQGITARAGGKAEPKESGKQEKKNADGSGGPAEEKGVEEEEVKKVDQEEEEEEGKKVSEETEKTESKSDKELESDITSENAVGRVSSEPCPMKYDSPLQVFSKVSDCSARVDPNVMVCQFDLMGVCKDEECTYQHLRILAK